MEAATSYKNDSQLLVKKFNCLSSILLAVNIYAIDNVLSRESLPFLEKRNGSS